MQGDTMRVIISQQSACAGCHAKSACAVSDAEDKEIDVSFVNGVYHPGQEVTVLFRESAGFKALFYGYLLPFTLVLLMLIILFSTTNNELISGLLALGILIPYYITLYFFRDKLKRMFIFELEENC
jgi:positive regulator of sigma E activity